VWTAAPDAEYQRASSEVTRLLRHLVDQWIDSAIDEKDGSESPFERKLSESQDAYEVAEAFLNQNRPALLLNAGRNAGLHYMFLPHSWTPPGDVDDPVAAAQHTANDLFVRFLDSGEFVHSLFRCRRCGRYFERRSPRDRYKRGSYCGVCVHKATATRSTDEARKTYRGKLLDLASQAWILWEKTRKNEERSVWIARWVNDRLSRVDDEPIKRNWITRNREEIAAEANKRKVK